MAEPSVIDPSIPALSESSTDDRDPSLDSLQDPGVPTLSGTSSTTTSKDVPGSSHNKEGGMLFQPEIRNRGLYIPLTVQAMGRSIRSGSRVIPLRGRAGLIGKGSAI